MLARARPILRLALVASLVLRAAPTAPPPRFDDPDLQGLIASLESDAWTDDHFVERRREALERLRARVAGGGPALVEEAVRRVGRGGPDERRRAQLVLAQVPDVPARLLAPLLESDDPAAWLFARLRSCGADELERLDREATERLDRSLGTATAEDPVAVVAEEVRRRLGPDEGRLLGRVPPPMKRWWDLDGDERREMALFSLRSLGSRKGLAAAAVVGRPAADAPWSIRWFRPFEDSDVDGELLVTDLDGDGREEALLRWEIVAGWCWGCALVLTGPESLERPLELTSSGSPRLRVFLVQRSPAAAPFLVTWGGHRETNGGKAVVYSGLLAWEARMHALRRGRLEAAGSVFLPTMKLDAPKDSIGNPSARGERRAAAPGG